MADIEATTTLRLKITFSFVTCLTTFINLTDSSLALLEQA
jgi:hypothetical protein